MKTLEDKFKGKYEEFARVNLVDFSDNYFSQNGIYPQKILEKYLYDRRDKEVSIKVAIAVLTAEEWELLKQANWLITRYKLDKGNRQKLEDYWKGKQIWDDVVSGKYEDRVRQEKARKEAEKKEEKEKGFFYLN
jgi:hypothetical protein